MYKWITFFEYNPNCVVLPSQMLTIMHQNIASALSKMDILELTLADFNVSNDKPDVVCLSETFLKSGHENSFRLSNYELAAFYSRHKKRGGVCILVKTGLSYKKNTIVDRHAVSMLFECCGVDFPDQNLTIICLYRTPTSNVENFLNKFDSLLYDLTRIKNKKVVILGDININTLKIDKISNTFQDISKNYNMKIHIKDPTRRLSCIDHIVSNIENASASVLHLGLSDHETNKKQKPRVHYIFKRDYSIENIMKFKNCMHQLSFNEVLMESNMDKAFEAFHDILLLFYNLCFPKVKMKIYNNVSRKKWLTAGLRKSCKTKRMLRIKYYKFKTSKHKDDYFKYSKLLKKCISRAQKNYNNKFINNSKNKCKASWQVIKDIEQNNTKQDIENITYGNEIFYEPKSIAEAFGKHFIESSNKLTQNIQRSNVKINAHPSGHSMYLRPMTEIEVKTHVLSHTTQVRRVLMKYAHASLKVVLMN